MSPAEKAEVEGVLGADWPSFLDARRWASRNTALRVMRARWLPAGRRPRPRELLQAALLHDVGKSAAPLSLGDRTLVVLARRLAPAAARRWGQGQPSGWRRPFVTARQQPSGGLTCARRPARRR